MSPSTTVIAPATPDELAAAEAALESERQREAALGLFARRMTHDMSNFVTVIRTYSELLLGDLPADADSRSDVQEIYRAADAIVEYLHRVGRFARSGGTKPSLVHIDELLAEVAAQFIDSRAQSTITISSALNSSGASHVEAIGLADAIRELLINACEASPANNTVWLRSWDTSVASPIIDAGVPIGAGEWTVIEVADNGSGFSPEVRDNASDPFVTTKSGVRGAGFGLSLARGVAWQVGGQIVTDDSEGGARVRLWLPAPTATR